MNAPTDHRNRVERILFFAMLIDGFWIGVFPARYTDSTMHITLPLVMTLGMAWSVAHAATVETQGERRGYYGLAALWLAMLVGVLWMYSTGVMHPLRSRDTVSAGAAPMAALADCEYPMAACDRRNIECGAAAG